MPRLTIAELRERCQKPDPHRLGNAMARHVTRPLALRVTWLLAPSGISAHGVTLSALGVLLLACGSFAVGGVGWWLWGSVLLQVWYVLDHVDGQIARLRKSSSLDGVQLDYLMHHLGNLCLPMGLGWGVAAAAGERGWIAAGFMAGVGLLLLGLQHDARYKAFVQRWKLLHGELRLLGGGGGRPQPPPGFPNRWRGRLSFVVQKVCEPHVVMNLVGLVSLGEWFVGEGNFWGGRGLLGLYAVVAPLLAIGRIARSIRRGAAEQEFAAWLRPLPGEGLSLEGGWWHARPFLAEPDPADTPSP